MGLINAAVPADRLDDEVDAVVDDLLAGGPGAIAAAKRLLAEVPGMPVDEAFRWTGALSAELFASDEAREGMRAYLEKRPAAWVVRAGDTPSKEADHAHRRHRDVRHRRADPRLQPLPRRRRRRHQGRAAWACSAPPPTRPSSSRSTSTGSRPRSATGPYGVDLIVPASYAGSDDGRPVDRGRSRA